MGAIFGLFSRARWKLEGIRKKGRGLSPLMQYYDSLKVEHVRRLLFAELCI